MKDGFIKISCVTPLLKVADCRFNADRIIELIKEAHSKGVKIVCFPELSVTGYTCGDLFLQEALLDSAKNELCRITEETAELDIVSVIGVPLVVKGKLSFYQGDGNLYGWLGKYVVGYIYRANPDRRREMPVKSVVPYADVVHDDTVVNGEERRLVDQCLGRMWLKNPMRAYVHYMKLGEGLSSREILRFFGLSSEANVDQIFSRAVKSMRKLRREHV